MTCKDCIHNDLCMDKFTKQYPTYTNKNITVYECEHFKNKADFVEVKYGYWEIVKGSNGKEKMVCTNCRHQQDLHSTFTYCPNCGALIDGRVIHNG